MKVKGKFATVLLRPDELDAIRAWMAVGMSPNQIGYLLNRCHSTIYWAVARMDIPLMPKSERRALRSERAKLRAANGLGAPPTPGKAGWAPNGPPMAPMSAAKVRALYAGRRYDIDPRAARSEPRWAPAMPAHMVDCGMSSSGWAVM